MANATLEKNEAVIAAASEPAKDQVQAPNQSTGESRAWDAKAQID